MCPVDVKAATCLQNNFGVLGGTLDFKTSPLLNNDIFIKFYPMNKDIHLRKTI
jgi:hypothetical protein